MVLEELLVRLNDKEYTNWLKAGRCLIILKVIISHHRQPESTINWDNCCPPQWKSRYWELAKAYMPRGQAKMKDGGQCDASALLNLINHCKWFSVDPKLVREVIRMRNELMHSCDLRVKDEWVRHFYSVLRHFVQQFSQEPQMAAVQEQIEEMLTVDLSIYVSGEDGIDSAVLQSDSVNKPTRPEISAGLVSQWESELLQEMLQEMLQVAAEDGDVLTQDTQQMKSLSGFLQANRDLGERFSAELQAINSLEDRQK